MFREAPQERGFLRNEQRERGALSPQERARDYATRAQEALADVSLRQDISSLSAKLDKASEGEQVELIAKFTNRLKIDKPKVFEVIPEGEREDFVRALVAKHHQSLQ